MTYYKLSHGSQGLLGSRRVLIPVKWRITAIDRRTCGLLR